MKIPTTAAGAAALQASVDQMLVQALEGAQSPGAADRGGDIVGGWINRRLLAVSVPDPVFAFRSSQ
jgi:hypothetical protein